MLKHYIEWKVYYRINETINEDSSRILYELVSEKKYGETQKDNQVMIPFKISRFLMSNSRHNSVIINETRRMSELLSTIEIAKKVKRIIRV